MAATRWRLVLIAGGAGLVLSACGGPAAQATPTPPEPTVAVSVAPTVTRAAASPLPSLSATLSPTATSEPAQATTVWVGNTDGQGVFVRKTPSMADRLRAYPDATSLAIVGEDVDADGQHWKHVKTPDGLEGYVPAVYTVENQP